MSAIYSNTLKSEKSHLHQLKPENNSPVFLKVTNTITLQLSISVFSCGWPGRKWITI